MWVMQHSRSHVPASCVPRCLWPCIPRGCAGGVEALQFSKGELRHSSSLSWDLSGHWLQFSAGVVITGCREAKRGWRGRSTVPASGRSL